MTTGPEPSLRNVLGAQFAERLHLALAQLGEIPRQGRGRLDAVASLLGTSVSTTQRMLSGAALPEAHRLVGIAEKLGVTIDYLMGVASLEESNRLIRQRAGKEILISDEYLAIPILNPHEGPDAERYVYAGRTRIARFVQPVDAAAMIFMHGESMAPTVLDAELMLIARIPYAGVQILPEGLYPLCCRARPEWTLRRIQPVAGGNYLVSCDNSHYASLTLPHGALAEDGDYEWMVGGRLRTVLKRY